MKTLLSKNLKVVITTVICFLLIFALTRNTYSQVDPPQSAGVLIGCGETVILEATGSTGDYIWYSDEALTDEVGTGSTYETPEITEKTTYFVVATDGVDISESVAVKVNIDSPELLIEPFRSSSLPDGWQRGRIQGSIDWQIVNDEDFNSHSGGYYAIFDDREGGTQTPNEAWIQTKPVFYCGVENPKLSFYEHYVHVENTYGFVEITKDGGSNWEIIKTNNSTIGSLSDPVQTVVDIDDYVDPGDEFRIRFRYLEDGAVGQQWYIDDVNVFASNDIGIAELVSPSLLDCGSEYSNNEEVIIRLYNYSFQDIDDEISWEVEVYDGLEQEITSYSGTHNNLIPADSYVDINVGSIDMSDDDVYHFIITADLPGDGNKTNNKLVEGRRQMVRTYPYMADFNFSPSGWTASGENPQPENSGITDNNGRNFIWGDLPYLNGAEGEGHSWFTHVTGGTNSNYIWVESPVFDFSNISNPELSMDIKYHLSSWQTGISVQYTIDGENWHTVGRDSDPEWYNLFQRWADNSGSPVDDWTNVKYDLCALAGESCVQFRVYGRVNSGSTSTTNQFAFNNFRIDGELSDDVQPIALTLPKSSGCGNYSDEEGIQVMVRNNGCRTIWDVPVTLNINGTDVASETIEGPIERFDSYKYTFDYIADLSQEDVYTVTVTTNLDSDDYPDNDEIVETRYNDAINVEPGEDYIADFNDGNEGWASSFNQNDDGTRYFRLGELPYLNGPEGEGNTWFVETTTNLESDMLWVESPEFNLSNATDPILYVDLKYQIGSGNLRWFRVEYSIDGGNSWNRLGSQDDPNWYDAFNGWQDNLDDPVENWTTMQKSLCDLVNPEIVEPVEQVCVKFRIVGRAHSGISYPRYGDNLDKQFDNSHQNYFAFTNFKILNGPDVGVTNINHPNKHEVGCLYDSEQNVSIRVNNFSCGTVSDVPVEAMVHLPEDHPDYPSSPLTFSGNIPSIEYDEPVNFTFPGNFDMTPKGEYKIIAWTDLDGDLNNGNDTTKVIIDVEFPKITDFPFIEDFNDNDGQWVASGENPPDNNDRNFVWGELPDEYLNGPEGEGNSWYVEVTGGDNSNYIWLESPVFDLSEVSNPVLYMDVKYELSSTSSMRVEYSLDGENWNILGDGPHEDWYNSTSSWRDNAGDPVDQWTEKSYDLCPLAGESCVKFRIYGRARGASTSDFNRFAVDNFRIDGGLSDDIAPIAITLPNSGSCGEYTDNETVQVLVKNNLCRPLTDIPVNLNVNGVDIADEVIPGPVERYNTYLYTFTATADLTQQGENTIVVTTELPTDGFPENDQIVENRFNNSPIEVMPGNDYIEDFDDDNGGWVSVVDDEVDGTRYFRRGELPYLHGPEGQGKSWYVETTTHNNSKTFWVESPIIDLSEAVNPILSLDLKFQLRYTSFRWFRVEYSIDDGPWETLGSGDDTNWYNSSTRWQGDNFEEPLDEWSTHQVNLCEVAGEECVKFRIVGQARSGHDFENNLNSNDRSSENYFAFDNFKIVDGPDVAVKEIIDPGFFASECLYELNQEFTIEVENYSCQTITDIPVYGEIVLPNDHPDFSDSPVQFSGIVPEVESMSTAEFTFDGSVDMTPMGQYIVSAWTDLTGDINPDNDFKEITVSVNYPKISEFPYIEDFNDGDGDWQSGGDFPPDNNDRNFVWGELPADYLNGPEGEGKSWYIEVIEGNYSNFIWVESPVFDFSNLNDPVFMMDIKYKLASSWTHWHQVRVEYSVDGHDWNTLGHGNDPNWYNQSTIWNNNANDPVDEWTTVFNNLCHLAGEECVKFRIIGRVGGTSSTDFAFDNVRIFDGFKDASVSEFLSPLQDDSDVLCSFDLDYDLTVNLKLSACEDMEVPVYANVKGPNEIEENFSGVANIDANTNDFEFTFDDNIRMTDVGFYEFTVWTELENDGFPYNDTITQIIEIRDTLITDFPYYADFNDGKQNWRATEEINGRRFEYGTFSELNGNEHNGKSWFVYIEDDAVTSTSNSRVEVISPVFDISELENPILSMEIKYRLWHQFSNFRVDYSTDGGENWTRLGTDDDPNWYEGSQWGWQDNFNAPVDRWKYVERNLCELTGESCVQFKITGITYYAGDNSIRNFFAFDNFAVFDSELDAQLKDVYACYGNEYHLELDILNSNNFCDHIAANINEITACYDLDGDVICEEFSGINITPGEIETLIIPNVYVPHGLEFRDNLAVGGIASSDGYYTEHDPERAFNGDILNSGWADYTETWLQYQFDEPQAINTYRFYNSANQEPNNSMWNSGNTNPATWELQGSNNETDWEVLHSVPSANVQLNQWNVYTFENSQEYEYYRIYFKNSINSSLVNITELEMYNVDPEPSSLKVWIQDPNGLEDDNKFNDTIYVNVNEITHCYDHCVAAIELVEEVTQASSTHNATHDPEEDPDFESDGCSGVTLENTVWYKFNSNCYGKNVSVDISGISCDIPNTGIQVSITRLLKDEFGNDLEECVKENHEELFCWDGSGGVDGFTWESDTELPPNTWYYITIDGEGGSSCEFQIEIKGDIDEPIYQTVADGNWTDPDIWEIYLSNAEEWVPAINACEPPFYPTSKDSLVYVRHTVVYDKDISQGVNEIIIGKDENDDSLADAIPKLIIPENVNMMLVNSEYDIPGHEQDLYINNDTLQNGIFEIQGTVSFVDGATFAANDGSKVIYSGNSQTIYSTYNEQYYDLVIDGSSANLIDNIKAPESDITVNNSLEFVNGIVGLNNFDLNIPGEADILNAGSLEGWVDATGEGSLNIEYFSGTNQVNEFPIGGQFYSPANINIEEVTQQGFLSGRVREDIHPEDPASIKRYWNFEANSLDFVGNYDMILNYTNHDYVPEDPQDDFLRLNKVWYAGIYSNDEWTLYEQGVDEQNYNVNVQTNTAEITHDSFSDFTLLATELVCVENIIYRTISDGDWTDSEIWEIYLTSTDEWVDANLGCEPPFYPTSKDSLVFVRHNVIYDEEVDMGVNQVYIGKNEDDETLSDAEPKLIIPEGIEMIVVDSDYSQSGFEHDLTINNDTLTEGILEIQGSLELENNATYIANDGSTVIYSGESQFITSTFDDSFYNLIIDGNNQELSENTKYLLETTTIRNQLEFVNGILDIYFGDLIIPVEANIINAGETTGWVDVVESTNYLIVEFSAGNDVLREFPVGGQYYSPATIEFENISVPGHIYSTLRESVHPHEEESIKRYWTFENNDVEFEGDYEMILNYTNHDYMPEDPQDNDLRLDLVYYVGIFTDGSWLWYNREDDSDNYVVDVETNTAVITHNHFSDFTLISKDAVNIGEYVDLDGISIKLFPNPVSYNEELYMLINVNKNQSMYFNVNDIAGRKMISENIMIEQGENIITIPIENLNKGAYILNVNLESKTESIKFIITGR